MKAGRTVTGVVCIVLPVAFFILALNLGSAAGGNYANSLPVCTFHPQSPLADPSACEAAFSFMQLVGMGSACAIALLIMSIVLIWALAIRWYFFKGRPVAV